MQLYTVAPVWIEVERQISIVMGETIILSVQQKLFGVKPPEIPSLLCGRLNHVLMVAKMVISKFKYGNHGCISNLLNYEIALRKLTND